MTESDDIILVMAMRNWLKKLRGGVIVGVGYMLSPLSWWNDVFFNLPIALVFGYAIGWLHTDWFLPGTIIGYWLSNVLGVIMMQFGAMDMFLTDAQRNIRRDVLIGFGGSTFYTIAIAILFYYHILEVPEFLLSRLPN